MLGGRVLRKDALVFHLPRVFFVFVFLLFTWSPWANCGVRGGGRVERWPVNCKRRGHPILGEASQAVRSVGTDDLGGGQGVNPRFLPLILKSSRSPSFFLFVCFVETRYAVLFLQCRSAVRCRHLC